MDRDSYDVVIIGAGVIGCAAARELAPDHEVLVVDKGQIAAETTAKASGLVSIVHDYDEHPDAARYALEFFDEFDGTGNFSYTRRPSLQLVDPEIEAEAREDAERIAANGFEVSYLDIDEVEERYPGMFVLDDFVAAVEFSDGGWVDPYTLAMTMKDDAEASGATFETGVTVESIQTDGEEVRGLETDAGTVEASHVVCAAGWRTRELVSEFVDVPVRPFRYQTLNLETDREFEETYPVAWEEITDIYWRPEHNGDLHVGGGTYFIEEPGDVRTSVTEEYRNLVAEVIFDRVGGLEDARFVSGDTCTTGDSATPDEMPIIDAPSNAPDGLVLATGAHGFGIMGAPVFGGAVRALVADEDEPFALEPFALARFDSESVTWESDYIVEPGESLPSP